jgi:ATP-binding cassette subfamily B protein
VLFVYRSFPLARLALALTLTATAIEYATFSLMLPLSGQQGGRAGAMVESAWGQIATAAGAASTPRTWLWFFLMLLALRACLEYGLVWTNTLLSKRVQATLSNDIFTHVLQREPMERIYARTIGHYITLAGDDTSRAGSIVLYFGQFVSALLDAAVGLGLLYVFSPLVFLATLCFGMFSVVFVLLVLRLLVRINARSTLASRALNTYGLDALNGVRSLRSMAAERYVIFSYAEMMRRYLRLLFRAELLKQAMKTGPAVLLLALGVAWAWPGMPLANQDRDPLYFVGMVMLLVRVFVAMGSVVTKGERLVSDIRAVHDIDELTSMPNGKAAREDRAQAEAPIGKVELRNVSFCYAQGTNVVDDVTVAFESGSTYALVGESGGGKSTLADVILGLLPATSGAVVVNGTAMSSIPTASLRRRSVLVEQQTRIFTGSIRENILLGHECNDQDLELAIAAAEVRQFVASRAEGLEFALEYQGANLSGGQRQRIGIARALVRKPDVLILDEATSALDPAVRNRLLEQVKLAMRNGILILITHDAEVAAVADSVYTVSHGRLRAGISPASSR